MCLPDCPLFFDVELIVKRENVKKKIGSQSYPTVSALSVLCQRCHGFVNRICDMTEP